MCRILLVFLLLVSVSGYAQWQVLHPGTPLHHYLSHAVIPNGSSTCLAIGNMVGISSDGGITWQEKSTGQLPVNLTAVTSYYDFFFTDATTGFFLFQNEIYKTTDGGVHWEKKLSLTQRHPHYQASAFLQSVFFLDDDHGFAVGEFEKLFETTDGGETWNTVLWSNETAPYRSFSDVTFLNDQVGFISGYEVPDIGMNYGFREFVMKTVDGGKTWTEAEVPTDMENRFLHLQFVDEKTGFVRVTKSQFGDDIFATQDGGSSWSSVTLDSLRNIRASHWIDANTGLMFGRDHRYNTKLFRTEDRGVHWTAVSLPVFSGQDEYIIQSFAFTDDAHGYAVGSGGSILYTSDKGKTWQPSNTGYPNFYTIDFVNEQKGYASSGRGFFTTDDGGNSWQYADQSDSLIIMNMKFNAQGDGIFYGFRNNYYRVREQGQKIESIQLPVTFLSISEVVVEGDSVFACGLTLAPSDNVFLRSGDNGVHWEKYSLPTMDFVIDLGRAGRHFYAGTSHSIVSSRNGKDWITVKEFPNSLVEKVLFLDESVGLAVLSGAVMRTNNGGHDWEEVMPRNADQGIYKFVKASDKIVFAHGYKRLNNYLQGAIWKSSDAGRSWQEEQLPELVSDGITDMCRVGDKVYASGGFGQIFRYTVTEPITSVETWSLDENLDIYPVPTEGQLHLRLKTTEAIHDVQITDLNGRHWTASYSADGKEGLLLTHHLPPALYIVTVSTNKHVYRRKFLTR